MIGHVAGAPVEELLPLLGGVGAGLVLARVWVVARVRRLARMRRRRGTRGEQSPAVPPG